jgi:thiamine-monophosphate kinase
MNEWEIITKIRKALNTNKRNFSKIGDDVAYIDNVQNKVIVKADMLLEKTDVPRQMTYRQAARKSIVSCVSDFAAKGIRPKAIVLSVGLARKTNDQKISDLIRGFQEARNEFSIEVIGGDTNEADCLVIDCVMIGNSDRIVPRSGAEVGDIILSSGLFGYTSAGMKILLSAAKASNPFKDIAVKSVLEPKPALDFGLLAKDYSNSSIDSSDGLALSLYQLAEASKVGIVLDSFPVDPRLLSFARRNSLSPFELVLYGGEEFQIIATVPEKRLRELLNRASKNGIPVYQIGRVTSRQGEVVFAGPPKVKIQKKGWTHLGVSFLGKALGSGAK